MVFTSHLSYKPLLQSKKGGVSGTGGSVFLQPGLTSRCQKSVYMISRISASIFCTLAINVFSWFSVIYPIIILQTNEQTAPHRIHMIQTQIEHLHKLENCPTPCLHSLERNAGDVKHHAEICGATSPGLFLQKSRTCSDKAGTCFAKAGACSAKAGACSAKQRTCGSTIQDSNYACPLVRCFQQTPSEGWCYLHQWLP